MRWPGDGGANQAATDDIRLLTKCKTVAPSIRYRRLEPCFPAEIHENRLEIAKTAFGRGSAPVSIPSRPAPEPVHARTAFVPRLFHFRT